MVGTELRKITAVWTGLSGLPGTTTMYFDADALELGDLLTGLDEFWTGIVTMGGTGSQGLQSGLTITLENEIPIIEISSGHVVDYQAISESHSYAGNGTAEPLPPATQMLIEWKTTSVAGTRRLRGRTFLGGLTEDHSTNGAPASTHMSTVQALADSLSAESMAIFSPTHNVADGPSAVVVWNRFAVLRSRRD